MKYSPHNIIKRKARSFAANHGIPLSKAIEQLARDCGFAHNYEMARIAKRNPMDRRLLKGAFGLADLQEVVYQDPLYYEIAELIDDAMSGPITETNAEGYGVDSIDVIKCDYDQQSGGLDLVVQVEYSGEQKPDQTFCGDAFSIDEANLVLYWRGNRWDLAKSHPFEIIDMENTWYRNNQQ